MVVVICVLRSGLVNSPFAPITNDQERTEVISGLFFVFVFLFFSFLFSAKEKRLNLEGRAGNSAPPTSVDSELVRLLSALLISCERSSMCRSAEL